MPREQNPYPDSYWEVVATEAKSKYCSRQNIAKKLQPSIPIAIGIKPRT